MASRTVAADRPRDGTDDAAGEAAGPGTREWLAFAAVSLSYLCVTVGESILAPVFPAAAEDLDLDLRAAGAAFSLLTISIAAGNVAGGYVLARRGPKVGVLASLALTGPGSLLAAAAPGTGVFLGAQVLLGLGAGVFFAPAINAVGGIGGARRRGLAMGLFGIAFSGGLTAAALLAALGARVGWRTPFAVGALLAVVAAVAVATAAVPGRRPPPPGGRRRLRDAIGVPAVVGSAAAVSQYGTIAFLPTFAVVVWGLPVGRAALLLALARVLSVPAKLLAGHAADRLGPLPTVRLLGAVLGVTGVLWTLLPERAWAVAPAVVFAATVSAVFPVANLLAYDSFGSRGPLLGTYRSVQMGVGAVASAAIGAAASTVGLRPTLACTVAVPATLAVGFRRRTGRGRPARAGAPDGADPPAPRARAPVDVATACAGEPPAGDEGGAARAGAAVDRPGHRLDHGTPGDG